ncbi:hypothetical protein N5P37_010764 [Trichoderma harzianum]|nr:hypothetical protein N5P37_010764 [Trichoderma harzianum]
MEAPESRKRTREDDGALSIRSKRHQSNNGDWQSLGYCDYTVGWVCALPIEMAAAEAILDSIHAPLPRKEGDPNTYTFGRVGEHNVVIACLPASQYGTNNAATVASNMSRSYSSITIRLMVGIGGGVPDSGIDIRLGDVVVGNEVIQYDLGKVLPDGQFQRTGRTTTPPHTIMTAVSKLQADYESAPSKIPSILLDMLDRNEQMTSYARPSLPDRLFPDLLADPTLLQSRMEAVLNSLTFEQIDSRHATIKTQHSKTCQWLLGHSKYVEWLEPIHFASHHGFLWINGKPGAGKSTLMKFSYTYAKNKWKATADANVISFFFNARGVQLEKSTEGMYRSLLFQVIQKFPDVLHDSDHIFQARHNQATWDIETLQALFTHAATKLGQRQIICFIDALDECDISEVENMVEYFEDLGDQAAESQTKMYICFSSRHYPHIDIRNGLKLILEDQPGHGEDLEKYVRSKLRAGNSKASQEVSTEILERASGVFLWVVLVVDILNREFRDGRIFAVKQRLKELPDGLSNLFKDILCRDNHNMDDLLLCIQWIVYAARPLTCEEYYFALVSGLDPSPENLIRCDRESTTPAAMELYLLSSSKGLAELVKSKARTVQFIHESVRDFLIKENGILQLWPNHAASFESYSHDRLKQCCDNYCNIDISERVPRGEPLPNASSEQAKELRTRVSEEFPFLDYATRHVLHHSNAAEDGIPQVTFLKNFTLKRWLHLYNLFQRYEVHRYTAEASLVYILAEHNLPSLVRSAINNGFDAHPKGERYRYPLLAALKNGHEEVYKALQPHCNASDKIVDQNDYHKGFSIPRNTTVLHYAAEHGNLLLLTHLLEFMTPTSDAQDRRQSRTPLSYAASNGSEACLRALLSCGAHIEAADKNGWTPLVYAVQRSHEAAIRLLLNHGAQIEAADKDGWMPLAHAVGLDGKEAIVRLLLDRGAQIEAADKNGRTPLLHAANRSRNEAIIRLLLDRGAQAEVADKDGRTPLSYAANRSRNEAIIRLLLDRGAQAEVADKDGRTPLSYAADWSRNEAIIRLLLDRGAQAEVADKDGRTPLSYTVGWSGNKGSIQLLLARGAQTKATDKDGRMPLSYAVEKGDKASIQLLLDQDAQTEAADKAGRTLLSHAAGRYRNQAVVQLLLDRGAEIEAADKDGRTPLLYTAGSGDKAVVRLLLDRGAEIEAADKDGRTPLLYAAGSGDEAVVRLLLDRGAEIKAADKDGRTLLSHAAGGYKNEAVVQLLLNLGIEIEAADKDGRTPLSYAAESGDKDVVRLLLDRGAQIEAADKDGRTPLSYAASVKRNEAIVQLLQSRGAKSSSMISS